MIDLQDGDAVYIYNIAGDSDSIWDVDKPLHLPANAINRKTQETKPLYKLLNEVKKNNRIIRVERKRKVIYIG